MHTLRYNYHFDYGKLPVESTENMDVLSDFVIVQDGI